MSYFNQTQRDLMRLFLFEFLRFLWSNLRYKCLNSTELQRLTESIFVEELKNYPATLYYEQIILSINSVVTKYLTF